MADHTIEPKFTLFFVRGAALILFKFFMKID
jgi:hypothetical protein